MMKKSPILLSVFYLCLFFRLAAQIPAAYNPMWNTQSIGSHESMPCGGGSIGMNVWVENDNLYFYFSRSGTFDENNAFLKGGRIKIELTPNPFQDGSFQQELKLQEGYVEIQAGETKIELWADVFQPVIYVEIESKKNIWVKAGYESWRFEDFTLRENESHANSYKFAPPKDLKISKDIIEYDKNDILFFHRNPQETVFDVTVESQLMSSVKNELYNPLANLTFGGKMSGKGFISESTYTGTYTGTPFKGWAIKSKQPSTSHHVKVFLHTAQTTLVKDWKNGLEQLITKEENSTKRAKTASRDWWKDFWQRSFIVINPDKTADNSWNIGRNYQLFRYMLGCNAYGSEPTKFNGGLFTFDPVFVDTTRAFTPDFRLWGGGTMTAQNQRLVYFPMIKSGDFDMLPSQFNFYTRILQTAELRSLVYWGHTGACFTEQIENFGLPNISEDKWQPRHAGSDPGVESNPWLEYCWDTALEFGLMMLDASLYSGASVLPYIPFIESVVSFFDEHYRYLAGNRGTQELDENGQLVLYPGSACETYKMATNATSTIAALKTILQRLLALEDEDITEEQRQQWSTWLNKIPPINFRTINNKTLLSPAKNWERINNEETPQLYPVYPWRIYGIGRPDIQIAKDTYFYDPEAVKFRSYTGWKQDNIFAACLGLIEEARKLTLQKLGDGPHRFPAFWGPGFDWTPDHNWGGSGMIGLQEMLLQTINDTIILFPAWPENWNVHFRLHAPKQTIVEAKWTNGKPEIIRVTPASRQKDIILWNKEK